MTPRSHRVAWMAAASSRSCLAALVACAVLAACQRSARRAAGPDPDAARVGALPTLPPAPDAMAARRGMDLSGWPRMAAVDFGCLVERELQHRDVRYHCGAQAGPPGDPCKNTRAYYAGPSFPAALSGKVHPLAEGVTLAWEHGQLQSVTLFFAAPVSEAAVRADLGLPPPGASLPGNMSRLWLSEDGKALTIEGFDHMGAGDVDCKH